MSILFSFFIVIFFVALIFYNSYRRLQLAEEFTGQEKHVAYNQLKAIYGCALTGLILAMLLISSLVYFPELIELYLKAIFVGWLIMGIVVLATFAYLGQSAIRYRLLFLGNGRLVTGKKAIIRGGVYLFLMLLGGAGILFAIFTFPLNRDIILDVLTRFKGV